MERFRTILIGGDSAKKAAGRIGEFDYLIEQPLSVVAFVNPASSAHFQLVKSGEKWSDVPIFDSLSRALENDKDVNSVGIHFNAKHVLHWVKETVKHPQIKTIVILAEDVPEKDAREIVALQKKHNINILGPSSLGIIVAGQGRIGELCGEFKNLQLCKLDQMGCVGVVTKSGTIAGEMAWVVSQNSPGVSTIVQIGGDTFPATDFVHWLDYFSRNKNTKVVILAGEAGGDLEERAAEWLSKNKVNYKVLAAISGKFMEKMPKGQKFGHAGAKQEESGYGSAANKVKVLREAGVEVVEFEELGKRLKSINYEK